MRASTLRGGLCVLVSLTGLGKVGVMAEASAETRDPDIRAMVREVGARSLEHTVRTLVSFGTRNTLSAQDDPKRGIGAARDWLYAELKRIAEGSGGRMTVELQSFVHPPAARVPQPTTVTNVVAILKGETASPEQRLYVASGHYDSMCSSVTDATNDAPGANDDGSGVAAVLELARVMAKRRFAAPIAFVCVAGEEQGLLGATHFAEQARQKGWHVEAMLDLDTIGSSTGGNGVHNDRSIRVFSEGVASNETPAEAAVRRSVGGENDSPSRQLARYIKETGERYVPGMKVTLIYRRDRYGRGGDHIPFLERGWPAVRLTEPNEDYRHQHQNVRTADGVTYGDLPEFVDYPYLARVTRIAGATLAEAARAPAAPTNVTIAAGAMSYDTELRWARDADPGLAGYEVVWRETTASVWTHVRAVGKETRCALAGISKDNYFSGVRAVGKDGHRSPVTFPRPAR